MKIYTAALYSLMAQMRLVRDKLVAAGHEVTATWIDGEEETKTQEEAAIMDLVDIQKADCVLFFAQPLGTANRGGGRHFELGYGYALRKLCVSVGERETVFHHLPGIRVAPNLDEAIEYLSGVTIKDLGVVTIQDIGHMMELAQPAPLSETRATRNEPKSPVTHEPPSQEEHDKRAKEAADREASARSEEDRTFFGTQGMNAGGRD